MIKNNNGIVTVVNNRDPAEKAKQELVAKVLSLQSTIQSKLDKINKEEHIRREFQSTYDLQQRKEASTKN